MNPLYVEPVRGLWAAGRVASLQPVPGDCHGECAVCMGEAVGDAFRWRPGTPSPHDVVSGAESARDVFPGTSTLGSPENAPGAAGAREYGGAEGKGTAESRETSR